jgi:hypothetical protein
MVTRARRPPEPPKTALEAFDAMLATFDLDEVGEAKAAIGRALASKLDQAAKAEGGAVAMSVPGIARELREIVDAILEGAADGDGFVVDLFSKVGNAAKR